MITGCRNWQKMPSLAYAQTVDGKPNGAVEEILLKHNSDFQKDDNVRDALASKHWLETCSTHTDANCAVAIVLDVDAWVARFSTPGDGRLRPPDALCFWENTPQNAQIIMAVCGIDPRQLDYMANEAITITPVAVRHVFAVDAVYKPAATFDSARALVSAGASVKLPLVKDWKSGDDLAHYVGAYAYDDATDELLYVDPAPYRHPDGHWADARMGREEYSATVRQDVVAFMGQL